MILSHKHKFIFICNGKTGTTSIEAALEPYQEGKELDLGVPRLFVPKHIPPALLRGVLPAAVWDEYFKFVFVRNPWDLFVSNWYHNAAGRPSGQSDAPSLRTRIHRRLRSMYRRAPQTRGGERLRSLYRAVWPRHPAKGGVAPVCFSPADVDYLFDLLKQERGLPGADGYYQSNWVYDVEGNCLVDFVGRFENLAGDVRQIADRIGVDMQLPHLNRTTHAPYRAHFDDASRRRVGERWEIDVRNFGYEF